MRGLGQSTTRPDRIGRVEGSLTALTLFFLTYSLPVDWFRLPGVREDGQRVFQGNTVLFIAVFGGLVSVLLVRFVARPETLVWAAGYSPLAVLFVLLALLSTFWSADPPTTVRRAFSLLLVSLFAVFLAARYSPRQLLFLLCFSFGAGTILNVLWLVAVRSYSVSGGAWTGIHIHKNGLGQTASFAMMTFWISARIFYQTRLILYLLAVISFVLVLFSTAASPIIAAVIVPIMALVYTLFRAKRILYGAVAFTMGAGSILAVVVTVSELDVLLRLVGKDASFTGRIPLWESLIPEIASRPILGYGWHAYFGGFFSPVHEIWIDQPWQPPHAHNTFLDLTLDLGLAGSLIYAGFLLQFIVYAARYIRMTGGPIGLLPIIHVSFVLIYSFSETLKPDRDLYWVLLLYFAIVLKYVQESGQPISSTGLPVVARAPSPFEVELVDRERETV